MNAVSIPPKVASLRKRDGDACWLCGGRLDFNAAPNSKKAPTKEHLVSQSSGGADALENLVLCHPGCNRQLGNRSLAEKLKIRDKKASARARQLIAANPITVGATSPRISDVQTVKLQSLLRRWQVGAIIASVVAALSVGTSLGLFLS